MPVHWLDVVTLIYTKYQDGRCFKDISVGVIGHLNFMPLGILYINPIKNIKMEYIELSDGTRLSRIGLGCRTMADDINRADAADIEASCGTINFALDNGINYLNTADFYNHGNNETLICRALKNRRREDCFISVKFGGMVGLNGMYYGIDTRPQAVENYLAYTLNRLGTDYVDLYQPCRINPNIPVEDTLAAVAKLVDKGKVKHVGLSEVDGETLYRASKMFPVSLVEVEYSFLNRGIERDLLPAAKELGIGVVAFNVLFGGLIGGRMPEEKMSFFGRIMRPELFSKLQENFSRFAALRAIADEKGLTLSQLSIAWVLSQWNNIMALVGSRTKSQVESSLAAESVKLSQADIDRISEIIPLENACCSYMLGMNIDKDGLFVR